VVSAPGRRAARRPRLDGAVHARGLRARRVRLRLRPAGRRRRRSAPVRGGRPGQHQGEHPARGRAPPGLHRVRRARATRTPKGLPPPQHRAVPHGRRAGPGPRAHRPTRAADRPAQPAAEHAGPRDGPAAGPRDRARPDPDAPVERLQRPVDHRSVARVHPRHPPGHRGQGDGRDRRDHRRRPGLRSAVRRPDGHDVHHAGDQGGDADLPAAAGDHPPQPQGRDARSLPYPQGRHHPGRHARRAARPALLGPVPRPVRPRAVRHGQGRQPPAPCLHPVLDREAAVHGARGHVHDAPRRHVRDLQELPAAAGARRDGDQEHDREHQAGRRSGHPPAPPAGRAPADAGRGARAPRRAGALRRARVGGSRRRSQRRAPTAIWWSPTAATSAPTRN
jgi:hypothetical protein